MDHFVKVEFDEEMLEQLERLRKNLRLQSLDEAIEIALKGGLILNGADPEIIDNETIEICSIN